MLIVNLETALSGPSSPSNLSSVTLVGSTGSGEQKEKSEETPPEGETQFRYGKAPTSPLPERIRRPSAQKEDSIPETIIHPPIVTTTPCSSGSMINGYKSQDGDNTGTPKRGSLKVDPQITINLSKPQPSAHASQSQSLSISPPQINLLLDRRPSAGANVIPQAALCQHRHSLQLNGDGGIYRVSSRVRVSN